MQVLVLVFCVIFEHILIEFAFQSDKFRLYSFACVKVQLWANLNVWVYLCALECVNVWRCKCFGMLHLNMEQQNLILGKTTISLVIYPAILRVMDKWQS